LTRKLFLTIAAIIALAVGSMAFLLPATVLASKGIVLNTGAEVWMREVGVLLIGLGILVLMVRNHADSPTLRAVLIANMLVQLGLLPIEITAYAQGVIPDITGIIPNSVVHVILAIGFAYFALSNTAKVQQQGL
jgi:hypothetical protein